MRQIGSIPDEQDAQRFAAYLVTKGIDSHAEPDSNGWVIWVRDENLIDEARDEFAQFRIDPADKRYLGAEREAEAIRRDLIQRRLAAQKNVIEMRGRWKSFTAHRMPLTLTLIALSVLVTLFGGFGQAEEGFGAMVNDELCFVSREDFQASGNNTLASVAKGEVWRTITPIFIHLSIIHLFFNMYMFFQFGRLVESLKGTFWFAMMVLLVAIVSNVAQMVTPETLGGSWGPAYPLMGGMSGVLYGLFGYAWVKSTFDPEPGFQLSQMTVIILMGWLVFCIVAMDNVANVAHVVGLVVGAACGYLPLMWRK